MRVLVTGGCGYKGSVLVPKLLAAGHEVTVWDAQWFGNSLQKHEALAVAVCDIRSDKMSCYGFDAVIHLAGIANDPCGELDARLTWEVNVLATMRLAQLAVEAGVKQFIFASSASVYGIQDNKPVTEDSPMAPVSDYNRTKMVAERVLMSFAGRMAVQILRPATVCGVSPRMRLDTMVNMLTMQAITKGVITAHCGDHGGGLMRPNTHIDDIADAYLFMLDRPDLTGCFNAGFENLSAMETAEIIASIVPSRIDVTKVKDKRSYAVDSSKLLAAGFAPKKSVRHAIEDIVAGHGTGAVVDSPSAYNLQWMRSHGWVAE